MSSNGEEVTALQRQIQRSRRGHAFWLFWLVVCSLLKLNLHFVFKKKGNLINIKVNCLSYHLKGHLKASHAIIDFALGKI